MDTEAEAGKELLKETARAFKAGLDGKEYENPFTEQDAEEMAGSEDERGEDVEWGPREGGTRSGAR